MRYVYTADSWDEFIGDLRTKKPLWGAGYGSDSTGDPEWSGSHDWPEAMQFAIAGHPAARAAIGAVAVKVTSAPEPLWDVAPVGAFPCIPAYAAGVPEDMFTQSEDAPPVRSPIVRIAVNMSASASVSAKHIVNRGAAIVALIDRIQSTGRRVELIAIKHGQSLNHQFVWAVTVKRPEEQVDMDRIGLAFATPIMLRRFFFRVMEFTVPSQVMGHGSPTHFPNECADYHLTLPNISGSDYSTPEKAVAKVMELWNATVAA